MINRMTAEEVFSFCDGSQNKKNIPGWKTIKHVKGNKENKQLEASIYQKDSRIVISFAGSNIASASDLLNDKKIMDTTKIPSQYGSAERLYNEIKTQYPNANIEFCGYSLGGSIANLLSHRTGLHSTALEPIGSKHIAKAHSDYFKYDDSNIVSFGRRGDKFFNDHITNQSGNIYIIEDLPKDPLNNYNNRNHKRTPDEEKITSMASNLEKIDFKTDENGLVNHLLHEIDVDGINNAKLLKDAERWNSQNQTKFQSPVPKYNKTYENLSYNDRVYYQGDEPTAIWDKDDEDVTKQDELEFKVFNRQLMNDNWKLPTKEELDERVARGELIWVDGYTKQDGTVVKGYFRHYPETA